MSPLYKQQEHHMHFIIYRDWSGFKSFSCLTWSFYYIESLILKVHLKSWLKLISFHMLKWLHINKILFLMWLYFVSSSAGAGHRLVHWLFGSHLLLVPRLPCGEQVQQGICHLRRCAVVGHGEFGALLNLPGTSNNWASVALAAVFPLCWQTQAVSADILSCLVCYCLWALTSFSSTRAPHGSINRHFHTGWKNYNGTKWPQPACHARAWKRLKEKDRHLCRWAEWKQSTDGPSRADTGVTARFICSCH